MSGKGGSPLPLDRSIGLQLQISLGPVWWGATWAVIAGLAAAGLRDVAAAPAMALGAWLVAVPLMGAFWTDLLRGAATADDGHQQEWSEPGIHAFWRRLDLRDAHRLFGLVASLAVAALLGSAAFVTTLAACAIAVTVLAVPASPVGWRRSLLEIAFPAVLAWTAVGGPEAIPSPLLAEWGRAAALEAWWQLNWPVPALLLGFTLVHHGATAVRSKADLRPRHRELMVGYVIAIGVLAAHGSGLTAGAVALLFVMQWPFQAAFRHGRVRWHLEATQGLAMAAMLVGLMGAGRL